MADRVAPTFTLVACDWTTRLAQVDTYESCTLIARFRDVSTYELVLPADTDAARVLMNASRPRLVIESSVGGTYRSGPVLRMERTADADADMLTASGVDDLVWLRRRLVHPQPATPAPPYSTSAYDVRTGAASQVIAGYVDRNAGAAAHAARRVPGLTAPPPAPFGGTITLSGRYQNLLEFVQQAAQAAGVGIRVRDLVFEVFVPTGTAVFSADLGTLAGWSSVAESPDATYVYVAGQGEETARVIREYADAAGVNDWGRIEAFADRRDTDDVAELDQTGAEVLADAARPISVEMDAVDTTSQMFLRDWNVGDRATVMIGGGGSITDVIAEAVIELVPNAPPRVTPALGGAVVDLAGWRLMTTTQRRLRQLERV